MSLVRIEDTNLDAIEACATRVQEKDGGQMAAISFRGTSREWTAKREAITPEHWEQMKLFSVRGRK